MYKNLVGKYEWKRPGYRWEGNIITDLKGNSAVTCGLASSGS